MKRKMTCVTSHFDANLPRSIPLDSQSIDECLLTDDCGTLERPVKMWFTWMQSKSEDPFVLLELCRSEDLALRQMGIKALAEKAFWEDYKYRYVAQAADYRTLIGLSRTEGVDPRFFLPPPRLADTETSAVEELASMLLLMDKEERNSKAYNDSRNRAANITATARAGQLIHHKNTPTDDDMRHFWGFDGSALDVASVDGPVAEDKLHLEFLSAIANLCNISEQALLFVKKRGLAILQRLTEEFENTETFTAVASVLGNLAFHPVVHKDIVNTGWLGVLKEWSQSKNSQLAVAAARVLANLDAEFSGKVLRDGIFILHPLTRSKKTFHADVIFLHGLLGGAIKTWRQKDRIPSATDDMSHYTDCWPKDWLAEDCPDVRIISIHYDAGLSSWSTCRTDKIKCTLEGRSSELLEKLRKAGVGQRPIIWVGHSMGGLLIKQMLDLPEVELSNSIKDQTCGVLLYAVPHRGLPIAALTRQIQYIIYPSIEVQELRKDSAHLRILQSHFKDFIEANSIPCLSFGEATRTRFRKNLPKILLVPPDSSDPGVGEFCTLPLDHINICKPESRDSPVYQKSLAFIHRALVFSYIHRIRQAVSSSLESLD